MGSDDKFKFSDALNTFFLESREMLDDMENLLLELEKDTPDEESIHTIFRIIHTIKGSSGMFELEVIEKFTHILENLLEEVRKEIIEIDSNMVVLLFDCHDFILKLLTFFENDKNATIDETLENEYELLVNRLKSYFPFNSEENEKVLYNAKKDEPASDDKTFAESEMPVENQYWHISLRFKKNTFKNGLDPFSFISYLREIGEIINIKTVLDSLPPVDEMNPQLCYLGFEIDFKGDTSMEELEDVFEFTRDDCTMKILQPRCSIKDYVELITNLPEKPERAAELLKETGSITENEMNEALKLHSEPEEVKISVTQQIKKSKPAIQKIENQKNEFETDIIKQSNIKGSIRIDAVKLDNIINLVGELVVTGANVKQLSERTHDSDLIESVSIMSRLIEDIRDSAMNARMVPIGNTFKRYERVVRDLSYKKKKQVDLIIRGGDTELDKTLIEKISDPLLHLIRNAIDHGIDLPEERAEKGKPIIGKLILNAYYETGSIVIEIIDDGNGLNKEKIIKKALEQGLIQASQVNNISDRDITRFILEPGFSTADEITNISGRGVGLDVVRKNIESLRGTINIESAEGEGTKVIIHLPLTLAIIDGFMVKVGDLIYILPLDMVIECSEISKDELKGNNSGNIINLRGEALPFLRMRDFFNEKGDEPKRENIIVVEYAKRKVGLVVDKLLGEFQTVIKPLGRIFNKIQWISGATILGTGEVALILDVPQLIQYVKASETKKAG